MGASEELGTKMAATGWRMACCAIHPWTCVEGVRLALARGQIALGALALRAGLNPGMLEGPPFTLGAQPRAAFDELLEDGRDGDIDYRMDPPKHEFLSYEISGEMREHGRLEPTAPVQPAEGDAGQTIQEDRPRHHERCERKNRYPATLGATSALAAVDARDRQPLAAADAVAGFVHHVRG